MDKSLEEQNLSKLTHKEVENKIFLTIIETESVILKNVPQ